MTTTKGNTPDEPSLEIRELLRRRAAELSEVGEGSEPEEQILWFAAFSIEKERFALPLESVRAIIPLKLVTPVPLVPAHVIGVVRFRGEIITAFSLAALLRGRAWRIDSKFLLVVEPRPGRIVALDCAEVPVAMTLPARLVAGSAAREKGALREVVTADRSLISIIDVTRLGEGWP